MIFIIGQSCDPHVRAVIEKLDVLGLSYFVFDIEAGYKDIWGSFRFNTSQKKAYFGYSTTNKVFSTKEISSVWWRVKPPFIQQPETLDYLRIQNLKNREWLHFLTPLCDFLQVPWINNLKANHEASFKTRQLEKALSFGFTIPETIISNNYNEIIDFVGAHSEVIYKPLTYYYELPDKITSTTLVTDSLLKEKQLSFMVTPGIYQERIKKLFELRITIVGNQVFSARIDTNHIVEAQLDWRDYVHKVDFSIYKLSETFERKLLSFHKSLGLIYGAYDFIVTPNNDLVFLEVNPAGQWLWLEEKLGLSISEALAKELSITTCMSQSLSLGI